MEFCVRQGKNIGTFTNLSLNGGWWWDFGLGPNYVFALGAISYPVFLTFAWKTIPALSKSFSTDGLALESNPDTRNAVVR